MSSNPLVSSAEWQPEGIISSRGTHYILTKVDSSATTTAAGRGGEEGAKPLLVVCVHGIGAWSCHFEGMCADLAKSGYSSLRYDNLGMGHTVYPESPFLASGSGGASSASVFAGGGHVEQLRDLLQELDLWGPSCKYRLVLLAHSMGGAIASLFASTYPEAIVGLVLLSPAGTMDMAMFNLLRSSCCKCLANSIKAQKKRDSKQLQKMIDFGDFVDKRSEVCIRSCSSLNQQHIHRPDEPFEALWSCVLNFPFGGLEPKIRAIPASINVLLMHAEDDTAVPFVPNFQRYKDALSSATSTTTTTSPPLGRKFVALPGVKHGFFVEFPDRVMPDILAFLSSY